MAEGFIKLNRNLLEWGWHQNPNTMQVWIHILLMANWKSGKFEGKEIPRGSLATSYDRLATICGISKHQVRTALDHLKETGEVALTRGSKYTMITIKNYDLYQTDGTQMALNWHSDGTQMAPIEERKNRKKERIYAPAQKKDSKKPNSFNEFTHRDYDMSELEMRILRKQNEG